MKVNDKFYETGAKVFTILSVIVFCITMILFFLK